jgi:hypothetical protein
VVQISASGSLYFHRYTLWKIGFLTSPITILKHVFQVKMSYILQEDPNSVRLVSFERGTSLVFWVQFLESGIKYWTCGILYKFSLQNSPKINKVWESYHNFHLEHQILVRPMELQRRHIIVLQAKISDSEGPKFQKYIRRKVGQKDRLQIRVSKVCLLKTIITFDWDV